MRGALRTGLGVAVAGLAAGLIPTAATAAPACKPTAVAADEAAMTAMIAAQRKAAKVAKVAKDPVLWKAGRQKSLEMARGGKFAHSSGSMSGRRVAPAPRTSRWPPTCRRPSR